MNQPCTSNNTSYSYPSRYIPADVSSYTFTSHLTQDSITQLSTEQKRKIYKLSKQLSKSQLKVDYESELDYKIDKAIEEIEFVANQLKADDDVNDVRKLWPYK